MDPTQLVLLFLITKPLFLLAAIAVIGWHARRAKDAPTARRELPSERVERARQIQ